MSDGLDIDGEIARITDEWDTDSAYVEDPTKLDGVGGVVLPSCSSDGEVECSEDPFKVSKMDNDACVRVITLQSYLSTGELGNFSTDLEPNVIAFPGCQGCEIDTELSTAKLKEINCLGDLGLTLEICTAEGICAPSFSIPIDSGDLEYLEDQELEIDFKP